MAGERSQNSAGLWGQAGLTEKGHKGTAGVTGSCESRLGKRLHSCTHPPKLKAAHLESAYFTVDYISI